MVSGETKGIQIVFLGLRRTRRNRIWNSIAAAMREAGSRQQPAISLLLRMTTNTNCSHVLQKCASVHFCEHVESNAALKLLNVEKAAGMVLAGDLGRL